MHAAELRDRVVAVFEEDPLVELFGPTQSHGRVDAEVARQVEIADELVEEEPAQALRTTRVAGEQGALHDLGQVHEGEHGPVEVREVRPEGGGFVVGEAFGHVRHGLAMVPAVPPGPADPRSLARTSGRMVAP